jgi:lipopolysaccharide transport system ATP-binding protein
VIYLKKGQIVYDGPTAEGLKRYEDDSRLADAPWFKDAAHAPIKFTEVQLLNERGEASSVFDYGERMIVRLKYQARERVVRPDFRVGFDRDDEISCTTYSTFSDKIDIPYVEGEGEIELRTPPIKLVSDLYVANIVVRDANASMLAAQIGGHFHVRHPLLSAQAYGVYHEPGEWRVNDDAGAVLNEAANDVRR